MQHQVNMNHHGQTIRVSPGDIIELQLEENPTTGYSWVVEDIPPVFSIQQNEYKLFSGAGMGGGGTRTMLLKVEAPEDGRISLKNRQPWSGDVYQSFELDVKTM